MRGQRLVPLGLLGLLLVTATAVRAAEGPTIDVKTLGCAAFVDMASKEPARFRALVGWLDGWLSSDKVSVAYSVEAQTEQEKRWLERCRAAPAKPLVDVVRSAK